MKKPLAFALASLGLAGCLTLDDLFEVRLDGENGIPALDGSSEIVGLDSLQCGEQRTDENGLYEIVSEPVGDTCKIQLSGNFTVVREEDYNNIPALQENTVSLVEAVEMEIRQLSFLDAETSQEFSAAAVFSTVDLLVDGSLLLAHAELVPLPHVLRLDGAIIDSMHDSLIAKVPVSVPVQIRIEIALDRLNNLPARLGINFEAQPSLVLGLSQLP